VDLGHLVGSFITSVSAKVTKTGALAATIAVGEGGGYDVVLVLSDVVRLCIDGGDFHSLVGGISVRRLPRTGAWPPEAHHLLGHHDNTAELVWLRLDGPTAIEAVAHGLRVEEAAR